MSLFSYNPANQLSDDVLLVIFDQLDEDDFLRCEVVCRRYRNFLLSQTPWRRLFHRKIVSSEKWRQLWRSFGVDETKMPSGRYRGLCRALIRVMNETDRNWRNGNFKTKLYSYDSPFRSNVTIGNDCIASYSDYYFEHENTIKFFDQCSPEAKSRVRVPRGSSAVTNTEIAVLWDKKNMKILDTDGQLICEVPELDEDERISWNLASCCISGDQVAVLSQTDGREKLSLWDVKNLPKVICLKSRLFNFNMQLNRFSSMKMDDQFIAVSTSQDESTNIYFFSKETLGLHWRKTVDGVIELDFVYGKGLLLLLCCKKKRGKSRKIQRIEMYDVTSGHFIRELPFAVDNGLYHFVCFNSKFMVVAPFKCVPKKKLFVYDLEAIKNLKSDGFVRTIVVKNDFRSIVVSETEIFCIKDADICILNFSPFGLFGNAAKTVTLSLPWRSVWRSKGVDEEPLEPVHHMEVYREVLKYFDKLSANCQSAIKIFPATDLMADDVAFYIENMNRNSEEIYSKTAYISKTTHVSLFGKTIQLIDSTTDQVVKVITLQRDAISLHFGQNLLVVVSKIAEHEHVLGIWRVDNSSNLTHLRDVTIGDYDGSLEVDEQFIAVRTGEWTDEAYNFISMKSFQVERSLSSRVNFLSYQKGCLFVLKEDDLVGILDVASGTFLRDIRIRSPLKYYYVISRCVANSNYVVIATDESKLYVYDLKCLKETDADPSHLLTTIDLKCKIEAMMISDTRIVCLCQNDAHVVDLKPVDRLRCPESC